MEFTFALPSLEALLACGTLPPSLPLNPDVQEKEMIMIARDLSTMPSTQRELNSVRTLDALSERLLRPCLTLPLATTHVRPLLLDLVARWIIKADSSHTHDNSLTTVLPPCSTCEPTAVPPRRFKVLVALALAKLLPTLPQVKEHAICLLGQDKNMLSLLLGAVDGQNDYLQELMASIYSLISYIPELIKLWDWKSYYPLLASQVPGPIRAYAALCLASVLEMKDADRLAFYSGLGITEEIVQAELTLQFKDAQTIAAMYEHAGKSSFVTETQNEFICITSKDLSPLTVDVCGILLPTEHLRPITSNPSTSDLVLTPTTRQNLHEIALSVSLGRPVLVQGPFGGGKTSFIEHIAKMIGCQDLLKIHLGDSTDGKTLLGSYVCTATPGEFRWSPGILTTAVTEGRWVVIEDIDIAPIEVTSILTPLLERRTLLIPARGEEIHAASGFRLFGTRRVDLGMSIKPLQFNQNLWTCVSIAPMGNEETLHMLNARFPNLTPYLTDMLQAFTQMKEFYAENRGIGRVLSLRDLVKWCERLVQVYLDDTIVQPAATSSLGIDIQASSNDPNASWSMETRERIFKEAAEIFVYMIPKAGHVQAVLELLGRALNVPLHRVEFYQNTFVPSISMTETEVSVGRVILNRNKGSLSFGSTNYASTSSALRLLERLAICTHRLEPVLLVGETGTGKTSVVQHLAALTRSKLIVLNMSQQSDSSDLLGGFKPMDIQALVQPLIEFFTALFSRTFSVSKNEKFLTSVTRAVHLKKWGKLIVGLKSAVEMANTLFAKRNSELNDGPESKRRKLNDPSLVQDWVTFASTVTLFEAQMSKMKSNVLFSFAEGALVKAIKYGQWVLLDEINLATSETLECLSGLLQGATGSLLLVERGDTQPIKRHPNFRIFACMNPANDTGKKDLPPGLRSRFTEFWVDSPDSSLMDLLMIIKGYLHTVLPHGANGDRIIASIAEFYSSARKLGVEGSLFDGANQRFHISLRTLTRSLTYCLQIAPVYGLLRSIYEGMWLTFMTGLSPESTNKLELLLYSTILKEVEERESIDRFLSHIPKSPSPDHILIDCFWLEKGPLAMDSASSYVLTQSVMKNLANLSRAVVSRRFPVLIQGPTSAGKTSMVEYLAKRVGHRFVRINNHEHTDLQEYLGSYVTNEQGLLVFQEGILVEALRKGYWIVLDELNLAPSEVLEALNRLLDDNRELVIPETQEVVRPHPNFMLFATQNPAGLYGGRKVLSRAFRNRFLELHFSEIPESELETILCQRCEIPPTYAMKLVLVYKSLQSSRGKSRVFDGKHGFITLRDLFRWSFRRSDGYQNLARDGYMLLAERLRTLDDREIVKGILEKELRVKLDIDSMYEEEFNSIASSEVFQKCSELINSAFGVVWNKAMKRLFVLVAKCTFHGEPVLLVGDTGCGKTTVCQILATMMKKELLIVNAHQHTETSDFLGSQRPIRDKTSAVALFKQRFYALLAHLQNADDDFTAEGISDLIANPESAAILDISDIKEWMDRALAKYPGLKDLSLTQELNTLYSKCIALFEWKDGPLVQAMKNGDFFLLDELSLADDSVLERLNSVLEPSKLLVLAEKGGDTVEELYGHASFQFLATMNPGGDYGKKELSPALRNRFTEIWVAPNMDREDLAMILCKKIAALQSSTESKRWAHAILDFFAWFADRLKKGFETIFSLRDMLSWASFLTANASDLGTEVAFIQGGCMVAVDSIGVNPLFGLIPTGFKQECLQSLVFFSGLPSYSFDLTIVHQDNRFGIHPFYIPCKSMVNINFTMEASSTKLNCYRVMRSLQMKRPILLEGSPGVGKTSLVASLAAISGTHLTRINLSEQTDLMDLFGSDLPVEGGIGGQFSWRDGPFLTAMQSGGWVLLDELNLASQQVLEGLNACLDHRSTVFIPELGKTFECHPDFRVFAAQNPQAQGGGRKGLPRSFLNRFTQVFVEPLSLADLLFICRMLYRNLDPQLVEQVIQLNHQMLEKMVASSFGWNGSPWEFNLRDLSRFFDGLCAGHRNASNMAFIQRFRSADDRKIAEELLNECDIKYSREIPSYRLTPSYFQVGGAYIKRERKVGARLVDLHPLPSHLPILESLINCVNLKWMPLLVGSSSSGKTSLVRYLASVCGQRLEEFSMNPGVDAVELLGSFEQVDVVRIANQIRVALSNWVQVVLHKHLIAPSTGPDSSKLLADFEDVLSYQSSSLDISQVRHFMKTYFLNCSEDAAESGTLPVAELNHLIDQYASACNAGSQGRFEWVDGILIKALEHGHWILIDQVNLCPASVLDRLNSLLENDGKLMVNERGLVNGEVKTIHPHPNFRIFMSMDPEYGEISRAMRNRGVELFVMPEKSVYPIDVAHLLHRRRSPSEFSTFLLDSDPEIPLQYRLIDRNTAYYTERIQRGLQVPFSADCESCEMWSYLLSRLPGSKSISNSMLSNILEDLFIALKGKILSSDDRKSSIALGLFGEFTSFQDIDVRISVLKFIKDLLSHSPWNSDSFCKVLDREVRSFEDRSIEYALFASLVKEDPAVNLLHEQPINLMTNPSLLLSIESKNKNYTPMVDWIASVLAFRRRSFLVKESLSNMYDLSKLKSLNQLTILEQSYNYSLKRVKENQLAHPCIKFIGPILNTVIANAFEFSETIRGAHYFDANKLLKLRIVDYSLDASEYLISACAGMTLDFAQLLLTIQQLDSINMQWRQVNSSLSSDFDLTGVNPLKQALGSGLLNCLKSLWITSRSDAFRYAALHELRECLEHLSNRLAINHALNSPTMFLDSLIRRPMLPTDVEFPKIVLEGISTLYAINHSKQEHSGFIDVLRCMVKEIETRLDAEQGQMSIAIESIRSSSLAASNLHFTPLSFLWKLNASCMSASLSVIFDTRTFLEMQDLLCDLSFTAATGNLLETHKKQILAHARAILRLAAQCSSSLSIFEPIQRFIWDLERKEDAILTTRHLADSLFQEMRLCLYRHIWKGYRCYWLEIIHSCEMTSYLDGSITKFITSERAITLNQTPTDKHFLSDYLDAFVLNHILCGSSPVHFFTEKTQRLQCIRDLIGNSAHDPLMNLDPSKEWVLFSSQLYKFLYEVHKPESGDEILPQELGLSLAKLKQAINPSGVILGQVLNALAEDIMNFSPLAILLEPLCESLVAMSDDNSSFAGIGRGWVQLSHSFLKAYIPDFAVDPAELPQAKVKMYQQLLSILGTEIDLRSELETWRRGVSETPKIFSLKIDELELIRQSSIEEDQIVYRPPVSQIQHLFTDLQQLTASVLKPAMLSELLDPSGSTLGDYLTKASYFQKSLDAVIDRLEMKYPAYRDVLHPVILSLYQIKHGIELLSLSRRDQLTLLPALKYFGDSVNALAGTTDAFSVPQLLVQIQSSNLDTKVIKVQCPIRRIHAILNEIVSKWDISREVEAKQSELNQSLYKHKPEMLEFKEDVVSIIPNFSDDFDDVEGVVMPVATAASKSDEFELMTEWVIDASYAHGQFISSFMESDRDWLKTSRSYLFIFNDLYSRAFEPQKLTSLGYYLIANHKLERLSEGVTRSIYDFYKDSNCSELPLLIDLLKRFDAHMETLLEMWPEHSALLQIVTLARRLVSFAIESPIMKFLTGLEIMLIRCQDWEMYASKQYSLKTFMTEISSVIVRWRKLELECWKSLLMVEDQKASRSARKLWPHIWKSIFQVLENPCEENMVEFASSLKQLSLGSSVGEFDERLSMLKDFASYLGMLKRQGSPYSAKPVGILQSMLLNHVSYYSQFSGPIELRKTLASKPINKELQDYVKIASWKDVNVFALKESAVKTHHHLNKFIKKYREILDVNVKDIITNHLNAISPLNSGRFKTQNAADITQTTPNLDMVNLSALISYPDVPVRALEVTGSEFAVNLPRYFVKMRQISDSIRVGSDLIDVGINEVVTTILERMDELQKLSPGKETALLKKRAFIDLLKVLSSLGFSSNSGNMFPDQKRLEYLYARNCPLLMAALVHPVSKEVEDADSYYFRFLAKMDVFRMAMLTISPNIQSSQSNRCVSVLEFGLNQILQERESICQFLPQLAVLDTFLGRMKLLYEESSENLGEARSDFIDVSAFIPSLIQLLDTTEKMLVLFQKSLVVFETLKHGALFATAEDCIARLSKMQQSLNRLYVLFNVHPSQFALVSSAVQFTLLAAAELLREMPDFASSISSPAPLLTETIQEMRMVLCKFVDGIPTVFKLPILPANQHPSVQAMDELVRTLLVAFQQILPAKGNVSSTPETSELNEFGLPDKAILSFHSQMSAYLNCTNVANVLDRLFTLLREYPSKDILIYFLPAIELYVQSLHYRLHQMLRCHRSVLKLLYVLSNTFLNLFKNGFCHNPEEGEVEDTEDNEVQDGMGLGTGDGAKDVSDEIEDQDQLEDLKTDDPGAPDSSAPPIPEEKNAVEMDDDFEGALEDVENTGADNDNAEDQDSDVDENPDENEAMDDLQNQGDVVDEQLWNDEEEQTDSGSREQNSTVTADQNTETVAKMEEEEDESAAKEDSPSKEDKDDAKNDNLDPAQDDGPEEQEKSNVNEPEVEENHGIDVKQDQMEIGEELGEDDDKDENGQDKSSPDQEATVDDDKTNFPDADVPMNTEDCPEGVDEQHAEPENPLEDELNLDGLEDGIEDSLEDMNVNEDELDPMEQDLDGQGTDISDEPNNIDEDAQDGTPDVMPESEYHAEDVTTEKLAQNPSIGAVGHGGQASEQMELPEGDEAENAERAKGVSAEKPGSESFNPQNASESNASSKSAEESAEQEINPRRSLADALKAWNSRLKNITDGSSQKDQAPPPSEPDYKKEENSFEFLQNDDEAEADAQVLAAATAEQLLEMNKDVYANKGDEESCLSEHQVDEDSMDAEDSQKMDEDVMSDSDNKVDNSSNPTSSALEQRNSKFKQPSRENSRLDDDQSADSSSGENQEEGPTKTPNESSHFAPAHDVLADQEDLMLPDELPEDSASIDYQQMRLESEKAIAEWRANGQKDITVARELWQNLVNLTRDLSFELCEQLRLILEPTLAAKMKGDYKSGKRLNMRKIIPYIASQFKKDKIWLKRSKPSKRTYQVMLAIDDSRSMAESHSIQLAYESLALISKALSQLEVGEISVVGFGDSVELIHPFESCFSDESGPSILSRFKFAQEHTQVKSLISTCTSILEQTKLNSHQASQDLWQLMLILSDGICEDHNAVRNLVRLAAEKKIMIVFLIIDNVSSKDSISSMTNVTYTLDPITQKSVLKLSKYMDTFPFDYYVNVRNIESLPQVLSEVMRQYFLMVAT